VRDGDIVVPCECWTRVVGYLRPVQNFHQAKKDEFHARKEYLVPSQERMDALRRIPSV
jgi:ribonucleoside-triphosphate reductase